MDPAHTPPIRRRQMGDRHLLSLREVSWVDFTKYIIGNGINIVVQVKF